MKTRDLAYMGMYLALFFAFDWLANMLPFFKMTNGGTLGLAVVPLLIASFHLGFKKGMLVALLSLPIQFMTGSIYFVSYFQFFLDYALAFGIYGTAVLFKNIYLGISVTNLIRLVGHVLSGFWYFEVPLWGSFTYNAWYMVPTTILCLVIVPLVIKKIKINA
ncbi:MAG: energy-coupled thiamine transporter ThiT [Erysipelotrichaceae bacterium]